jgi:hypothetical protein
VLEEEVEDGGGDLGANGGAQVHLVALQHVLNVAGPPVCHGPEHRKTVLMVPTRSGRPCRPEAEFMKYKFFEVSGHQS